jgi:hypothetical protein
MTVSVVEVLRQLEGVWVIRREIPSENASFDGRATFTLLTEGTYLYCEEGRLALENGSNIEAYRSYLYRAQNGLLLIDFNDGPNKGERFLNLKLEKTCDQILHAKGLHYCKDDIYEVQYLIDLPLGFTTTTSAIGPRKDYTAHSKYLRI